MCLTRSFLKVNVVLALLHQIFTLPNQNYENEQLPMPIKFHVFSPRNGECVVSTKLEIKVGLEYSNGTVFHQPKGVLCAQLDFRPLGCVDVERETTIGKYVAGVEGKYTLIFRFTQHIEDSWLAYVSELSHVVNFAPFSIDDKNNHKREEDMRKDYLNRGHRVNPCIATLLYSEGYVAGVITLRESLVNVGMGHFPFFVLVPCHSPKKKNHKFESFLSDDVTVLFRALGIKIICVEPFSFSPGSLNSHLGSEIWLKLRLWEVLSEFDVVLFLDADIIVLQNISELFILDKFSSVSSYFSSSVFVLIPSEFDFDEMMESLHANDKYALADQDFLNLYFKGEKYVLPFQYHCHHESHPFFVSSCKVFEFNKLGCDYSWKPWMDSNDLIGCPVLHISDYDFRNMLAIWKRFYTHALTTLSRFTQPVITQQYEVCVMTRVKIRTDLFLCRFVEWIEYHLQLGVDHIFITDDCSEIDLSGAFLRLSQNQITNLHVYQNDPQRCQDHIPDENKLFQRMFSIAKLKCNWITVIDMDEYITVATENVEQFISLSSELNAVGYPFVRMPWWILGSDGHEEVPLGLIIQNYHHGSLSTYVKTAAKVSELVDWDFTHFPRFKTPSPILPNGQTVKQFAEYSWLWDEEMFLMQIGEEQVMKLPRARIFLKHYWYLSWPEFQAQRSNGTYSSEGAPNIWSENVREKWEQGNYPNLFNVGCNFTKMMARKVQRRLKALQLSFCDNFWKV